MSQRIYFLKGAEELRPSYECLDWAMMVFVAEKHLPEVAFCVPVNDFTPEGLSGEVCCELLHLPVARELVEDPARRELAYTITAVFFHHEKFR